VEDEETIQRRVERKGRKILEVVESREEELLGRVW
jgi:hypothetical protein